MESGLSGMRKIPGQIHPTAVLFEDDKCAEFAENNKGKSMQRPPGV
jgi:hypothetical protein